MRQKISSAVRREVAARSNARCECCLLPEIASFYKFHLDHIRSLKHGGTDELGNLAYCCPDCNYHKGSNVGTFSHDNETLVRFFNPRTDDWEEHFDLLQEGAIHGKSDIGLATEKIFRFNEVERLIFRRQLVDLNLYP